MDTKQLIICIISLNTLFCSLPQPVLSDIIYESATLSGEGATCCGLVIGTSPAQAVGARFNISKPVQVTAIGEFFNHRFRRC